MHSPQQIVVDLKAFASMRCFEGKRQLYQETPAVRCPAVVECVLHLMRPRGRNGTQVKGIDMFARLVAVTLCGLTLTACVTSKDMTEARDFARTTCATGNGNACAAAMQHYAMTQRQSEAQAEGFRRAGQYFSSMGQPVNTYRVLY